MRKSTQGISILLISLFLLAGLYFVMAAFEGVNNPSNSTILNGTTFFNASAFPRLNNTVNAAFYLSNATSSILMGITTNVTFAQNSTNLTVNLNATNLSLAETTLGLGNAYNLTVNFTIHTNATYVWNVTAFNLTIDNRRPDMYNINVTDGSQVLTDLCCLNGTKYLTNVTLTVMAEIIDTSGQATLVYNYSNSAVNQTGRLERDYYVQNLNRTVIVFGPGEATRGVNYITTASVTSRGILNATIPAHAHGTNISFAIFANDSMAIFPGPGTAGNPSASGVFNSRAANNTVGYNFTVDGIRPRAQITLTEGGTGLDDQDTVTKGVTVVIKCKDSSGDTLPSASYNITVDRPGSDGNSPQTAKAVSQKNTDEVTLSFDTAGSGESNGEFTAMCNTQDIGGSSEVTQRFTVVASSGGSSGGGSTSGGGAGSTEAPETTTKKVEFASIDADKLKVVQNFGAGAGLKSISFKLKAAVSNALMEVTTTASKPSSVSTAPNSKIARYFEVKTTNIDNDNIAEATITFDVNKAWMETNNIKDNEVALYRYNNNVWEKYTASKSSIQGSTDKVTYKAAVPGFSVFAIGFAEATGTGTGTGEGTGEGTGTGSKAGMIVLWIVIIIVVVGAIWYYVMKKKKPSKK